MKVIFHIGMGKTGTSSIQTSLRQNAELLQENNACYLGMWFDFIDPAFNRIDGFHRFAHEEPDALRAHAETFVEVLEKKGNALYIHSNEGIFGLADRMEPFFSALIEKGVDVSILTYMRPPHDWLPSAFTQWNIRHKQQKGPVQTFATRAPTLLGVYAAAQIWHRNFPNHFVARLYDKGMDVVSDFAGVVGLPLVPPQTRSLERSSDAETVLRALFNDRFESPVMPELFNNTVMQGHGGLPRTIDEMIGRTLDFEGLDEIVADRAELFAYIKDEIGLDLRADSPSGPRKEIDRETIHRKLMDYLVFITLEQSLQIRKLKKEVAEIKVNIGAPDS